MQQFILAVYRTEILKRTYFMELINIPQLKQHKHFMIDKNASSTQMLKRCVFASQTSLKYAPYANLKNLSAFLSDAQLNLSGPICLPSKTAPVLALLKNKRCPHMQTVKAVAVLHFIQHAYYG